MSDGLDAATGGSGPDDRDEAHRLLEDWPYARDYLLATMDRELIERHAFMHLSRGLSVGTVVAFLGAGVSMSYGRISWKNLVVGLADDARQAFKDLQGGPARLRTLDDAISKLDLEDRPPGGDIKSDRYPSVFQLCSELQAGVEAEKARREGRPPPEVSVDDPFTLGVKSRTRDDHFHAFDILARNVNLKISEDAKRHTFVSRALDLIKKRNTLDQNNLHFREDFVIYISKQPEISLSESLKKIDVSFNIDIVVKKPLLRSLIAAAIEFDEILSIECLLYWQKEYIKYLDKPEIEHPHRPRARFKEDDVIATLRDQLHIRRFLTTNYDLEAERLIHDRNFQRIRHPPRADGASLRGDAALGVARSINYRGDPARDFVVQRKDPAPLVDFAISNARYEIEVAHLHGRALPGEPIVAAETEYQNFYLRDDGQRDMLDQALSLAFRANTLLFVGNGMGEDDILRPLRHFMSEGAGPTQPPAVALLPNLWGEATMAEEKISLLRRYGVYTIHWGRGLGERAPAGAEDFILPNIKSLIAAIGKVLNAKTDKEKGDAKDRWRRAVASGWAAGLVELPDLRVATLDQDPDKPISSFKTTTKVTWSNVCEAIVALLNEPTCSSSNHLDRIISLDKCNIEESGLTGRAAEMLTFWAATVKFLKSIPSEPGDRASRAADQKVWCEAAGQAWEAGLLVHSRKPQLKKLASIEGTKAKEGADAPPMIATEWKALRYAFNVAATLVIEQSAEAGPRRAARVIAREIEDAILSAFLSATLQRLSREWTHWKKDWFKEIGTRIATRPLPEKNETPPATSTTALAETFVIDRRHALALRTDGNPSGVPGSDRDFRPRWSQSFGDFLVALDAEKDKVAIEGRRVFFLAGGRGIGKGHFFSALTDRDGTEKIARILCRPPKGKNRRLPKEKIFGVFAFNLSFSVEIGSGFDRMADFMFRRIMAMYAAADPERKRLGAEFGLFMASGSRTTGDRVGAIEFLLNIMAGRGKSPVSRPTGRIVLAFNAAHLLYNMRGYTKNAEIKRIVSLLLDPRFKDAALDVFFVGGEARLPIEIREPVAGLIPTETSNLLGGEMKPDELEVLPLPPVTPRSIDDRADGEAIDELRIRLVGRPTTAPGQRASDIVAESARAAPTPVTTADPDKPSNGLRLLYHRIAEPRISVVIMAAFPEVALALALQAIRAGAAKIFNSPAEIDRLCKKRLKTACDEISKVFPAKAGSTIDRETAAKTLWSAARPLLRLSEEVERNDEKEAELAWPEINREFGRLYKSLGRSRLCISMACAAAEEVFDREIGTIEEALNVLNTLGAALGGSDDAHREDTVIREVLNHYRAQAETGLEWRGQENARKALKETLEAMTTLPADLVAQIVGREQGRTFFLLQEEVLEVLAMIGQPVEADCLSLLDFRAFADWPKHDAEWKKLPPEQADLIRVALVETALDQLVRRCLVFRFVARQTKLGKDVAQPDPRHRFSVHRLVQRHIFRRMHQPRVEFPDVYDFMPSLYASQPNDLPYPAAEFRQRIWDMAAVLSFYPSRRRLARVGRPPTIEAERAGRMLRAAYGMIRSVLPLAVVVRFDAYVPDANAPPAGFLEEHRYVVRWLLRRAFGLQGQITSGPGAPADVEQEEGERDRLPFFAGDIVWLYNECGVISLAQGRLNDAVKLFAVATRTVQRVEAPTIGGALTNAIKLNRAVADIERGKCRKADSALQQIEVTRDENRATRWIAHGYRGLVAHIRGDAGLARRRYDQAVKELQIMRRHRAASIFARHRADLVRRVGPIAEITMMAEEAVMLASIGNHIDVYHLALIVRLRSGVEVRRREIGSKPFEMGEVQAVVSNVKEYARIMGMPRLTLEAAHVDANIRFMIGDLSYANQAVTQALSLANEHGLVLKKVALTLLLARIYAKRGMVEGARMLAETARDLAMATEYAFAQDQAQEILGTS